MLRNQGVKKQKGAEGLGKRDSWAWATVWGFLGGRACEGINGNAKHKKFKKEANKEMKIAQNLNNAINGMKVTLCICVVGADVHLYVYTCVYVFTCKYILYVTYTYV